MLVNNRKEWLKARQKGIGGSDAASILGISPWKTNVQLWEEKTGITEPEDISEKEVVRFGKESEAAIPPAIPAWISQSIRFPMMSLHDCKRAGLPVYLCNARWGTDR